MKMQMQEHVCCNLFAVIENGQISRYVCQVNCDVPRCHMKANETEFVDLNDCKDRI